MIPEFNKSIKVYDLVLNHKRHECSIIQPNYQNFKNNTAKFEEVIFFPIDNFVSAMGNIVKLSTKYYTKIENKC